MMMDMASEQPVQGASIADVGFRKWQAFIAIAIGMFLSVAEQTGVAIALPEIAEDFDVNIPVVQWVTLGYVLSTSVAFMPLGRLADMVGRHRVYTLGFVGFIGMAVVAGLSPTYWVLLGAKVVQGVFSAGVQANAMAIMTEAFPKRETGQGHRALHDYGRGGGHGRAFPRRAAGQRVRLEVALLRQRAPGACRHYRCGLGSEGLAFPRPLRRVPGPLRLGRGGGLFRDAGDPATGPFEFPQSWLGVGAGGWWAGNGRRSVHILRMVGTAQSPTR